MTPRQDIIFLYDNYVGNCPIVHFGVHPRSRTLSLILRLMYENFPLNSNTFSNHPISFKIGKQILKTLQTIKTIQTVLELAKLFILKCQLLKLFSLFISRNFDSCVNLLRRSRTNRLGMQCHGLPG